MPKPWRDGCGQVKACFFMHFSMQRNCGLTTPVADFCFSQNLVKSVD
jgi:hypothetical protein